jgi:hypothetical protein
MAFIDEIVSDMTGAWTGPSLPDTRLAMADGTTLRNSYYYGASLVKVSSFAGIDAAMTGHNQYFETYVSAHVNWLLLYAGQGHTSTNACVEVRRMFCQVLKSDNTWAYIFVGLPAWGKRVIGGNDQSGVTGTQTKLPEGVLRVQPGPAIMLPSETSKGQRGYELWPSDWDGSAGQAFYGAINRSLMAQAKAFCWGAQVRLALWNPEGVDDRSSSRFVAQIGADMYALPNPGARYITDDGVTSNSFGAGYPYGVMDGNSTRWKYVTSNNWTWVVGATADDLWGYEADTPPPWGNWTPKWPYNKSPSYAITTAQLTANPPLTPPGDTTPPDPEPSDRLQLPSVGTWFAKSSGGSNAWSSASVANVPTEKIRRRRGNKIWS